MLGEEGKTGLQAPKGLIRIISGDSKHLQQPNEGKGCLLRTVFILIKEMSVGRGSVPSLYLETVRVRAITPSGWELPEPQHLYLLHEQTSPSKGKCNLIKPVSGLLRRPRPSLPPVGTCA